jgi:hypothetical protein
MSGIQLTEMNDRQQRAYAAIMAQIAMLPWEEREEVCAAVRYNGDICFECGMATDGQRCHCTNDE